MHCSPFTYSRDERFGTARRNQGCRLQYRDQCIQRVREGLLHLPAYLPLLVVFYTIFSRTQSQRVPVLILLRIAPIASALQLRYFDFISHI
jgi:hypothetical protein